MLKLSKEAIQMLEQVIYLPMVLQILQRDYQAFEQGTFKLKQPYLKLVEQTIQYVQKELANTKRYLRKNQLQVLRGERDDLFSEYIFMHQRVQDSRRYSNIRLRNHVEELLSYYLAKAQEISQCEQ
ncbi:hypothetical protein [Rummeliibacillus suwonensis]|jgi:hypothetical protein|uniref:hypothetical protein n=1 Tax=Rummeliibacillus suwonensis TaxID=1306154 RepID=UPI0011B5EB22|nr:hypothetical protein [Rummeliibacillus suwonensis]MBO2534288.1 hypothetical protein [Rummeliibacillus suwonensis]